MMNKVFVVNHGLHTGIVLNREYTSEHIPFLTPYFDRSPLIEFGWGDEKYYRADKVSIGLAAQSIFYPTDSVLHVVGVPDHPEVYFAGCDIEKIHIDEKGFDDMSTFIQASFKLTGQNKPEKIGDKINHDESYFFRANGKYHAFNTCNVWTAKALKASGFPINPFLKLTAGSVMKQIKKIKRSSR